MSMKEYREEKEGFKDPRKYSGRKKAAKPINAKFGKKNSNYRPGRVVPAIEESLIKEDDLG